MMNINDIGRKLCIIKGGKYRDKSVSIFTDLEKEKDDIITEFKNLKIPESSKYQQLPNKESEREIGYITGPSGSGKSTYCKNYILEYKKMYKDRPIYVFSALKDDETLDTIKDLKRVKIDNSLIEDPLDMEEIEESLVIFDDIDVISDKKLREAVYNILNQVLEIGRHHKISCLMTNHLATAGKDTRRILNESHFLVYFPHSGSKKGVNYLLTEYIGLDKEDIKKIKKSNSRWCCIFKNYPQIVMTEREIYLLSNDDN